MRNKAEAWWGRGAWEAGGRVRGTQEKCSALWSAQSRVGYWGGSLSRSSSVSHLSRAQVWSEALPGGAHISQARWFPVGVFLGGL